MIAVTEATVAIGPSDPIEVSDPSEASDLIEASDPIEVSDLIEVSDPSDPIDPSEAIEVPAVGGRDLPPELSVSGIRDGTMPR